MDVFDYWYICYYYSLSTLKFWTEGGGGVLVLQLKFVVQVKGDLNFSTKTWGLSLFERGRAIECLEMNRKIERYEMVINVWYFF